MKTDHLGNQWILCDDLFYTTDLAFTEYSWCTHTVSSLELGTEAGTPTDRWTHNSLWTIWSVLYTILIWPPKFCSDKTIMITTGNIECKYRHFHRILAVDCGTVSETRNRCLLVMMPLAHIKSQESPKTMCKCNWACLCHHGVELRTEISC